MANIDQKLIAGYAKKWPREVLLEDRDTLREAQERLKGPGVCVLYVGDEVYYVGRTDGLLFERMQDHHVNMRGRFNHFWNFFSAFVIPDKLCREEMEKLLITTVAAENKAEPGLDRIELPPLFTVKLTKHRLGVSQ